MEKDVPRKMRVAFGSLQKRHLLQDEEYLISRHAGTLSKLRRYLNQLL
jgi:hypothetical protein